MQTTSNYKIKDILLKNVQEIYNGNGPESSGDFWKRAEPPPPLSSPFTASMARPSLFDVGLDNFEMLFRGIAPDVF